MIIVRRNLIMVRQIKFMVRVIISLVGYLFTFDPFHTPYL